MTIDAEVLVEAAGWRDVLDLDALVPRTVQQAGITAGLAAGRQTEVSILLADDATVQRLNREWRGIDKPTNVLSFPASASPGLTEQTALGDIAVAYETVVREAADAGVSIGDHLAHLLVHGVFHLVGFDHETDAEADAMEALEVQALADLGIANPYADSEPVEVRRS